MGDIGSRRRPFLMVFSMYENNQIHTFVDETKNPPCSTNGAV